MKNLFDYATKELSQDAFLRWLFENDKDEKIGHIAKELLVSMMELYYGDEKINIDDISVIKTYAQAEKIDIVVEFKWKEKVCVLCIEDKVNSDEHSNQLVRYKEIVEKEWNKNDKKYSKSFFIYYKTHSIDDQEENKIKEANWKNFSFDKINNFWEKYQNDDNFLISMYAKHIIQRFKNSTNKELPECDNVDQWVGFFKNTVQPNIKVENYDIQTSSTYYGYAFLSFWPSESKYGEGIPYLEIRSKDCLNGKFIAIITACGCSSNYKNQVCKIIKNREGKGIFKQQNYKKQIGHTIKNKYTLNTKNDFIENTKEVIKEYLAIMEEFFSFLT